MKFDITTTATVSCRTVVEADCEDDALDKARERSLMTAPYNLGGNVDNEFIIEGFDGEPDPEDMSATPHEED